MEYRLSVRVGKTVVSQETHRTPNAAAERAEHLRRRAIDGTLTIIPSPNPAKDVGSDKSGQVG